MSMKSNNSLLFLDIFATRLPNRPILYGNLYQFKKKLVVNVRVYLYLNPEIFKMNWKVFQNNDNKKLDIQGTIIKRRRNFSPNETNSKEYKFYIL